MAMIVCSECGRQISDKAATCIGCGAPMGAPGSAEVPVAITRATYDRNTDRFHGTKALLAQACAQAVLDLRWKVDGIDEGAGIVNFTTGITWGSFSGVSGSVLAIEDKPNSFWLRGAAKQNLRGGQLVALNLFNEADKKVQQIVARVKENCGATDLWR